MKAFAACTVLLLALATVPTLPAQSEGFLLEDASGDVSLDFYDQEGPAPAGYDSVDLVSLNIVELPETLQMSLGVAAFPECPAGNCVTAGDTRTHFDIGAKRYAIQMGTNIQDFPYALLHEVGDNDFTLQSLMTLDATRDTTLTAYTVDIPRDQLVNELGAPLQKGDRITNIYTRAYSQTSFGGPDPDDPLEGEPRDAFVVHDTMGFDAPASLDIFFGGATSSGPISLSSPAPYRASNGGAASYRYDLRAINTGDKETLFHLEFSDVPVGWELAKPNGTLRLPAGEAVDFSVVATTPFGHQHGGRETFTFSLHALNDPNTWAETELGVHYVTVPQPSGHHPTLWFHSETFSESLSLLNTGLGGADGNLWMNTLEDDGGDQEASIQGWSGMPTNSAFNWAICLKPELLMGLDFDLSQTGDIEVPFSSPRGYEGAVMEGRVLYLGPGDPVTSCFPFSYSDREAREVATIEPTAPTSIGSSATLLKSKVTPKPVSDYIPYERGSLLVVELVLRTDGPVPLSGPESIDLLPGGLITLPLNEYQDSRPQGLIGWNNPDAPKETDDTGDAFIPEAESKGSPAVPATLLLAVLATLVALRRRE